MRKKEPGIHASVARSADFAAAPPGSWSSDLRRDLLLVLPALTLAAILGFSFLGSKSFWLDEACSVTYAQMDWSGLWHLITHAEPNMSLYYLLLRYWLNFGAGEAAVRSLSVIAAIGAVVPFFLMCRRLFGRPHAVIASILLSVNAFVIQYAQEARSYSLVLLLVISSSALFLRALAKPSVVSWLAYIVVSSLAVYAHVFAMFVILAQCCFAFLRHRAEIKRVVLADVAIMALVGPLLLWIRAAGPKGGWLKTPPLLALVGVFEDLTGHGGKALLVTYFLSCCLALYALFRPSRGTLSTDARPGALFALIWLFVPVFGSFIYSRLRQPIFAPRYLIVALPPLVMMAALGIISLKWRPIRVLLLVTLLALAARGVVNWYTGSPKEDWRGVAEYVLNASGAEDTIVFRKSYGRIPFEYYLRLRGGTARAPRPASPPAPWGEFYPWRPELRQDVPNWSTYPAPTSRRMWLVLSHTSNVEESAASRLMFDGYSRAERSFTGVRVVRYARPD